MSGTQSTFKLYSQNFSTIAEHISVHAVLVCGALEVYTIMRNINSRDVTDSESESDGILHFSKIRNPTDT